MYRLAMVWPLPSKVVAKPPMGAQPVPLCQYSSAESTSPSPSVSKSRSAVNSYPVQSLSSASSEVVGQPMAASALGKALA